MNRNTIVNIENHYSPKYERCFVQVSYLTTDAERRREFVPMSFQVIYDAFETRLAGQCNNENKVAYCSVWQAKAERSGDCAACRVFFAERMEN